MKRLLISVSAAALLIAPLATHGDASASVVSKYQTKSYRDGGVVLRMTGDRGSVLSPGEEISFSFQSADDAIVVLFNIDAEGYVHLLHPYDGAPTMARARETYRVPSGGDKLLVSGETGMEFVFAVTIPDRSALDEDELQYLREVENRPREERYRIDGDPFLAANIIAGELVRGISHRGGVFLDYTYFYVNQRVDHPCYLCGECDGGSSALCDDFELVADLDRATPLTYPLQRAYEAIDRNAPAAGEDIDVATATDDEDVNVVFYPYSAEVRYVTRPRAYAYVDYGYGYDPFWYDPWYSGYVYYPAWYYPYYGHYYSWSFSWGYWGGYYCSSWYYPRYRSCWDDYHHNYWDYARGYGRVDYKSAYKKRSSTAYKSGNALVTSRKQLTKRNSSLQIASKNLRRTTAATHVASDWRTRSTKRPTKGVLGTTRVTTRGGKSITRSRVSTTSRSQVPSRVKTGTRGRTGSTKATVKPRSGAASKKGSAVKRGSSDTPRVKGRSSSTNRSKPAVKSDRSGSANRSKPAVKSTRSRSGSSSKSSAVKGSSSSRPASKAPARSSSSSGKSRSGSKTKRK